MNEKGEQAVINLLTKYGFWNLSRKYVRTTIFGPDYFTGMKFIKSYIAEPNGFVIDVCFRRAYYPKDKKDIPWLSLQKIARHPLSSWKIVRSEGYGFNLNECTIEDIEKFLEENEEMYTEFQKNYKAYKIKHICKEVIR